jgi:hypothetical protein
MTIRYKNQGLNLTTTGTTSVFTAPSDATILVKQIQINNGSAGAVNLSVQITDASASVTFRIFNESLSASVTKDIINHTLVLEASDIIKMTAGTANEIQGIISYAQIDHRKMAKRTFKFFTPRSKPKKRIRQHKKNLSKSEKRSYKKYNRQGRPQ